MNEHHVLCVPRQEYRLEIERIYHHPTSSKIYAEVAAGIRAALPPRYSSPSIVVRGLTVLRVAVRWL
jgi:hypothetical protein